MAIAFDANLGSNSFNGGSTATFTLTTTAAAAAGSRVVVLLSWFAAANTLSSVKIGGVTATLDKVVANGSDRFAIASLNVAGGLAISSAILVTLSSAGAGGVLVGAASFTGIDTTTPVVTTGATNTTGANWSSGAATNTGQADALYVGGAGSEDTTNPTTSTAVVGTELHDRYTNTDQQGFATGYRIVSTVASAAITGTFSNSASTANTGALVIYAAAAGGASSTTTAPLVVPNIAVMTPTGWW